MNDANFQYPKAIYKHSDGWWVMQEGLNEFVLVASFGEELGSFGTLNAALNYMHKEFL